MPGHWDVLVASSDMEERRSLIRVCEGMSMNVISCNGLSQVEEVLSRQAVGIVFCDENLSDGSYRDLLTGIGETPLGRHDRTNVVGTGFDYRFTIDLRVGFNVSYVRRLSALDDLQYSGYQFGGTFNYGF